jgi:hypothetical protein
MTSGNLDNLAKAGLLDRVPAAPEVALRMFESARGRLRDASFPQNSNETRFECAYMAIRTAADVGLLLAGYRTSTSKPGHHQTAIQTLPLTLGLDPATVRLLDGMRKQRNLADYDGDMVTAAARDECIRQATALLDTLRERLRLAGWLDA